MKKYYYLIIPIVLILIGIGFRFLPHPPNFAPIAAIGLFAGFYLKNKWSWIIALGALLISDFFIGFYHWPIMLAVYLSFGLIGWLGHRQKDNKSFSTIAGSSLTASLGFFLITNLAVWKFSGMYAPTLSGLMNCYYLALPFFRNTILGDLFYVGILFGSWELIQVYLNSTSPKRDQVPYN